MHLGLLCIELLEFTLQHHSLHSAIFSSPGPLIIGIFVMRVTLLSSFLGVRKACLRYIIPTSIICSSFTGFRSFDSPPFDLRNSSPISFSLLHKAAFIVAVLSSGVIQEEPSCRSESKLWLELH